MASKNEEDSGKALISHNISLPRRWLRFAQRCADVLAVWIFMTDKDLK